ncbi:MAG: amino acid adenylation domain-containing protein [Pyrinomonadaceae bacterium]
MGRYKTIEGYRLSPQQQRVWLLQRRSSSLTAQCAILIKGQLQLHALRHSLDLLVSRHEALRTAFQLLPDLDLPLQVIADQHSNPRLRRLDYSALDDSPLSDALSLLLSEERAAAFDLQRGQPLHSVLVTLDVERHLLVLTLPALCVDSLSLINIVRELARHYPAGGEDQSPPGEAVQFVQFSEWQHELLESEEEAAGREFWQQGQLLPAEPPRLPGENARTADTASEPDSLTVTVEAEVAEALAILAGAQSSTTAALLACWQSLLWRLTAEPDISVEVAFSGRKYAEMAEALGLYSRWLPIRCAVNEATTFRDMLGNATKATSAAEAKQEFYAPRRVDGVPDGVGEAPPLPVGFEYEEWPETLRAAGLTWQLFSLSSCSELFKLRLHVVAHERTLRLTFHYDPHGFDACAIERLSAQYLTLLRAAVAAPDRPLSRLELLGAAERHQLLVEWGGAATAFPRERCLNQLFEAQAARTPQQTAVVYEDEQITYAQLNDRANRLAHHLRARGVGPEVLVGILLERSVEMIVAVLGTLKAGGAYVPLDPAHPQERISFMLEDAAAAFLLTQQNLAEGLPPSNAQVISVDAERETISGQSAENLPNVAAPDNLAYVIYTSGSTGQPKGVMIQHRSLVNLCTALEQRIYAEHEGLQRVSVNAPLSFDASVKQLVQLAQGRTLCLVPEWMRRDGEALRNYLVRHRVDVLDCTPSQLRMMAAARPAVAAAAAPGRGAADIPPTTESLPSGGSARWPRVVLSGGEAIDRPLWLQLAADPHTAYYNLYGPTECTVDASCCRISPDLPLPSIGTPLPNMQILILDAHQQLVPVGVVGELCIGGEGVGRGYLGAEELTEQKFIAHPFRAEPGARLYRTGDLGRHLPDGRIEYVGRMDRQVKLRGYRIELGEIEEVIARHGAVRECAVLLREDEVGDQRLVAYVVPHRARQVALRGRARHLLPNGLRIAHSNRNETEYLYEEIFTKRSYIRHGISLPEGACVFDVGANIGMFTLFVQEQCPTARVYAFEPLRELSETLRHNSRIQGGGVKVFDYGLSDREQEVEFTYYERYTMMSGRSEYADAASDREIVKCYLRQEQEQGAAGAAELLEHSEELLAGRFEARSERCQLRRLTQVIREEAVEQIDLLKVDVQRAEMDVLRGVEEEEWGKIKQLVMEVHDGKGEASEGRSEEMRRMLEARGYRVVVEQDELLTGTDRHNLYAVQEGWDGKALRAVGGAGQRRKEPAAEQEGEEGLRAHVKRRLPEYMAPSVYVEMSKLPLTRHGKVDWKALPKPEISDAYSNASFVAPANAMEQTIADIWQKVLRVEKVSRDANFFEIGGHSLLILQVCNQLRNRLEREIAVIELFKFPTVKSLARHLSQEKVEAVTVVKIADRTSKREVALRQQRQFMEERKSNNE